MIRMNRTTEYGLMALRHMSRKSQSMPQGLTNAREIADSYGLPFEITAKTLQRLRDIGLVQSAHGARGGYVLIRPLHQISLGEFLELMEGPLAVTICTASGESHPNECEYGGRCEIKTWVNGLNTRIFKFLADIPLAELAEERVQKKEEE